MKAREYRELSLAELQVKEAEARERIFKLRFQVSMGQTDGVRGLRATRRDLARILTVATEKRSEQARGSGGGADA